MMLSVAILLAIAGQLVSSSDQDVSTLTSASTEFSQRLYKKIALKEDNFVYSPYSIHSVLTMTSLGARGETLTEMTTTLGIISMGNSVHGIYRELIQQFDDVKNVTLLTSNGLFISPGHPIEPKFLEDTSKNYFAKTDTINMEADGGPEKPINLYVENQTSGMIKELVPEGFITGNTVMVLVNTLFFNGTWETSFKAENTKNDYFQLLSGQAKQIPMMNGDITIQFKRDRDRRVHIAGIPFKGGRFSFYIVLPEQLDGILDLEKLLARPGDVQNLFADLESVYAQLVIPKFKIETSLLLKEALTDLGIVAAFLNSKADFTGLSNEGAYINDVVHKAVIDVQETGTVASAASAVGIDIRKGTSENFIADHPFVYFLRDNTTGQILFQGKFSG